MVRFQTGFHYLRLIILSLNRGSPVTSSFPSTFGGLKSTWYDLPLAGCLFCLQCGTSRLRHRQRNGSPCSALLHLRREFCRAFLPAASSWEPVEDNPFLHLDDEMFAAMILLTSSSLTSSPASIAVALIPRSCSLPPHEAYPRLPDNKGNSCT